MLRQYVRYSFDPFLKTEKPVDRFFSKQELSVDLIIQFYKERFNCIITSDNIWTNHQQEKFLIVFKQTLFYIQEESMIIVDRNNR